MLSLKITSRDKINTFTEEHSYLQIKGIKTYLAAVSSKLSPCTSQVVQDVWKKKKEDNRAEK